MFKLDTFKAAISHLSKREKIALYAAVSVVSLVLFDRLIINPVFSKIDSLNKQIKIKESDIRKNIHILNQKDRILAEAGKYSSYLGVARTEEEQITAILREIENLANKASVYLVDLKPAGTKGAGVGKKYMVNLNCEAQMEQLIDFMYNIENSQELLTIEKYEIAPKSKDSSVAKCSISISRTIMP